MMNRIKRIVALSSIAVFACTLTGCASCQRMFKSWDSNMQNGLQRTIRALPCQAHKNSAVQIYPEKHGTTAIPINRDSDI